MSRTKMVMCPDCDGSGHVDEDGDACDPETSGACICDTCDGRGEVLEGDET